MSPGWHKSAEYRARVVREPQEPFHHAWEARMWAIARNARADDWTIDWWRHIRERIDPADYLTRPLFRSEDADPCRRIRYIGRVHCGGNRLGPY